MLRLALDKRNALAWVKTAYVRCQPVRCLHVRCQLVRCQPVAAPRTAPATCQLAAAWKIALAAPRPV